MLLTTNNKRKVKSMNNQFGELTRSMAQSATRRSALKKFGIGLIGVGLAGLLVPPAHSENPALNNSTVLDARGDAVFPYDLYGASVPSYLDIVRASVSASRGTFHFEVQMNAAIPSNADPGFTPSVNHLGPTFGLLTDPATAVYPNNYFGQNQNYRFNYFVGAVYSVSDSGVGLGLGWHGFFIDLSTFTVTEIPLTIRKDTLIVELPAALIGNPATMNWVAATECDPVLITEEKRKGALLVDFAPDRGYATWRAQ